MKRGVERFARARDLGEVESGGKMRALAGQHDGADVSGGRRVKNVSSPSTVPSSSALRFSLAREPEMGDRSDPRRIKRLRQFDVDRLFRCLSHPFLPWRQKPCEIFSPF